MYAVLSFSYKNLDIALRERLSFPANELSCFYSELFSKFSIKECVLLSTCNRFELLLISPMQDLTPLVDFIASYRKINQDELRNGARYFFQEEAVEHIFQVASSLDSLVIGETQITGQLKNAYKTSFDMGFCKKELTRVIHFAFKCAALIRTHTQISKNPTSVASVAISHFNQLVHSKDKVIVVGTGEIGVLCVKYLLSYGFEVILLSRTIQNAQALKQELNNDEKISVDSFSSLPELINIYPYLFSATGAPHSVVTQEMIKPCKFKRIWFDLALPRDIECDDEGIELFVIDDLQKMIHQNKEKRNEEFQKAQEMIKLQVCEFYQWQKSLEVEPLIKAFREKAKECCVNEVARAIKKGFLNPKEEEEVLRILHNAFNKFLHHPTTYIKTIKENPESDFILENIKKLFDLGGEDLFKNPYKCERNHKKD